MLEMNTKAERRTPNRNPCPTLTRPHRTVRHRFWLKSFGSGALGPHYDTSLEDELEEIASDMDRLSRLLSNRYEELQEHQGRGSHAAKVCPGKKQIERNAMD